MNKLGGGCVEPKNTFSLETSNILVSSYLRRIDAGASIDDEQSRLKKLR
jgi:hypothetical protein